MAVPITPDLGAQDPADLSLTELWPVLKARPAEKGARVAFEHCEAPVAALGPLSLVCLEALDRESAIERAHEARDLGMAAERDHLVHIFDRHRTQAEPVSLDQHAGELPTGDPRRPPPRGRSCEVSELLAVRATMIAGQWVPGPR